MKTPVMLLLTNDPKLEDSVAKALSEIGGISHLTHCASDALQTICGVGLDLDLVVVDFEHCPHGISLLSAINMCFKDLPIVVIARDNEKYVEALTYACGASDCLHKPVTAVEISALLKRLGQTKHKSTLVA